MTRCLAWSWVRFQDRDQRCQGKGWREDALAGSRLPWGGGGGGNGSADSKGLPSLSGGCQDYANCGASYTGEIQAGREGLGRGFCNRGTTTLRASVLATLCSHLDLVPLYAEQEDSPKSKPQLQS